MNSGPEILTAAPVFRKRPSNSDRSIPDLPLPSVHFRTRVRVCMSGVAHRTGRPNRAQGQSGSAPRRHARRVGGPSSNTSSFFRLVSQFVVNPLANLLDPGMHPAPASPLTDKDNQMLLHRTESSDGAMGGETHGDEQDGGGDRGESKANGDGVGNSNLTQQGRVHQKLTQSYETSPFAVWFGMIVKLFASALATAGLAISAALYPLYAITPSFVLNFLGKNIFNVGYLIYVTPLGRWAHLRGVKSHHKSNSPPHSRGVRPSPLSTCSVLPVPFSADNYAYVLVDHATRDCAAVDPADPYAVKDLLDRLELNLVAILTTHKHHDHAGGNLVLQKQYGGSLTIFGHKLDKCAGVNKYVKAGDILKIGETEIGVVHVPCHTTGHVVYAVLGADKGEMSDQSDNKIGDGSHSTDDLGSGSSKIQTERAECLFTGDAIINGGVGAFFHGGPSDCFDNLHVRLATMPDEALIFSGHEYMQMNLRYAHWLDETDEPTLNAAKQVNARRHVGLSTMPSSMFVERKVNPYFRVVDALYLDKISKLKHALDAGKKKRWYRRYLPGDLASDSSEMKDKKEGIELGDIELGGVGNVPSIERSLRGIETLQALSQYRHLIEDSMGVERRRGSRNGNEAETNESEEKEEKEVERTSSGRRKAPAPGPLAL